MAPAIDNAGVILGGSGRGSAVFSEVTVAGVDEAVVETASEKVVDAMLEFAIDVEEVKVVLLLPPLLLSCPVALVTGGFELPEGLRDWELAALVMDAD